jgi:hypothetical protein
MSKPRLRTGTSPAPATGRGSDPVASHFLPPLRPRRMLMVALGMILLIWMAVLLTMYFRTVYPQRHDNPRLTHAPADLLEH